LIAESQTDRSCANPPHLQSWVDDPATYGGPGHTLSVRAMRDTEVALQGLCASVGLTFWGQAAGMILDYFAAHPDLADLENLTPAGAPAMLLRNGGARRFANFSTSRNTNVILTPAVLAWIAPDPSRSARPEILSRRCALFLHRNAATGAELVRAARHAIKSES
jgi:hypothetical protein